MAGQEKNEKPVIKPSEKPSEKQPRGQRIKGLLSLFGKMSGFARVMFVIGAYGVIACTIRLIEFMITEGFTDYTRFLYLMTGIYLLDVGAKVFYMLPRELSWIEESVIYSELFSTFAFFDVLFGWLFLLFLTDGPTIGVFACWLYTIVWLVRLFKSTKKNGPMWQ